MVHVIIFQMFKEWFLMFLVQFRYPDFKLVCNFLSMSDFLINPRHFTYLCTVCQQQKALRQKNSGARNYEQFTFWRGVGGVVKLITG